MYSKFYGLSHKPFELTPNPDLIFLSETHQEALSVLLYGVNNRKGFVQISGNVGTGKSTLVQALIGKLENDIHICHIPNPNFTVAEFYYYISAKFGLDEFDGNRAKFILNLAEFLKQCREKDEFALLIIDEAQVLSLELLEEIRLLSNQEYTEFGVLSIFFVGQPELNALLKHKQMEPLRNRIGIRFNIDPLTLDETVAYIQFRLRQAGRTVLLFSSKAMQGIHELSGGIPRSINILCDNALLTGFAEQRGVIDESIIIECAKELGTAGEDSVLSESDNISITMNPESTSSKPVFKESDKGQKKKANALRKKVFFVFIIISVLFFAIIYSTEYWGRLPGTKPAKAWFEKFHIDESIFEKIKELFITPKSEVESTSSEKNMIPGKTIALSGYHEKNNNVQKKPVVESETITEPANNSVPPINTFTEKIYSKQNTDEINYEDTTSQVGIVSTETAIIDTGTTTKQIGIRRNPDGTNKITIMRQIVSKPATESPSPNDSSTKTIITTQNLDEINYVSISSQVGGANIRSGPSMKDTILRKVSPGYPLLVIDRQGLWTLIEDFKKREGWIANSLIKENNTVILMFDKGNLRSGPSYLDDVVADVDYGAIMQVKDRQGHWLQVNKRYGVVGWIHEDMVWP